MSGIYVVSVRRDHDHDAARAAAYLHVGLALNMAEADGVVLADSFARAGFGPGHITAMFDNIHSLAINPGINKEMFRPFGERGGVDSEGRRVTMFMFSLNEDEPGGDWLACVGAAHSTWPRLLGILGISVGVTAVNGESLAQFKVPEMRVPKTLRLKSGWDYDAERNQVHLPLEEAWRRLVEHNGEGPIPHRFDQKTMRKARKHMEASYANRAV